MGSALPAHSKAWGAGLPATQVVALQGLAQRAFAVGRGHDVATGVVRAIGGCGQGHLAQIGRRGVVLFSKWLLPKPRANSGASSAGSVGG